MQLTRRNFRLASGLVLFGYVLSHLLNHATGLASLDAAERMLTAIARFWQLRSMTVLLATAFIIHLGLAIITIYQRRNWRIPPIEIIRLWAGFSLPFLLIGHAVSMRVSYEVYGDTSNYAGTVAGLIASGGTQWQLALLAPGWVHGCLGLWISLRRYPLMVRLKPALLAILIGLPLLSALGFFAMAQELAAQGQIPPSRPGYGSPEKMAEQRALVDWLKFWITTSYVVALASAFLAGQARNQMARRRAINAPPAEAG